MTSTTIAYPTEKTGPDLGLPAADQRCTLEKGDVSFDEPRWPVLGAIGLSPGARALRQDGIGGSDANIILSGDPERVLALWREKRGEGAGEDLSAVLPVMLGQWTEEFNRQWYGRTMGYGVSEAGSVWTCPTHPWRRATLDGVVQDKASLFEAKHVSAFAKPDEMLSRYMPQLQHNMAVTGYRRSIANGCVRCPRQKPSFTTRLAMRSENDAPVSGSCVSRWRDGAATQTKAKQ